MDNLHPSCPDAQRHYPKGFEGAGLNTHPRKNQYGEYEWGTGADSYLLDPVLDLLDGALAPPAASSGDRYIILNYDNGVVHAGYGAAYNDIVAFDGSNWDSVTPVVPTLVFVFGTAVPALQDWYHFVDPNVTGGEWRRLNNAAIQLKSGTLVTAPANTSENNLKTTTVKEGTLNIDSIVEIEAWGTMNTGLVETSRIRLYFGSTVLVDSTAIQSDGTWRIIGRVIFNTATTQSALGQFNLGMLVGINTISTPGENINTNFTVRVTGQKSAGGDTITCNGMFVKLLE